MQGAGICCGNSNEWNCEMDPPDGTNNGAAVDTLTGLCKALGYSVRLQNLSDAASNLAFSLLARCWLLLCLVTRYRALVASLARKHRSCRLRKRRSCCHAAASVVSSAVLLLLHSMLVFGPPARLTLFHACVCAACRADVIDRGHVDHERVRRSQQPRPTRRYRYTCSWSS